MVIKFLRKINLFFKKENRKIFPIYTILIKVLTSLFIILFLPIIFFIIFIIKEPREIISINNYLETKIRKIDNLKYISYSGAKISLNKKLEIIYIVSDLELGIGNISLKFPNTSFKIRILDLLKKDFFLNEIEINDFIGYFGFNNDKNDEEKNLLSYKEINLIIHNILDYFNKNRLIFKKFTINNSEFFLFNRDKNIIEKINILNSLIHLKKNKNKDLNILLNSKLEDNNKIINSNNNCIITTEKDVNCELNLNDIFILDIMKIFNKNPSVQKYSENIEGIFNLKFDISFRDYTILEESNFNITSKKGSFFLEEFFPNKIYYKHLNLFGSSKGINNISLNKVESIIGTESDLKNNTSFLMSLFFKDKESMKLNFDISNAKVEDLNSFWPLFLPGSNIREWVISHFKSGDIDKAFAYMDFNYVNHEFNLKSIKSEVDFNNTLLNYSDDFPVINNLSAKAIFTVDDMNIYVNKGNIENTKILDGLIYTDFDKPTINIKANTNGDVYEMFYFIDNNNKENIKEIVNNYFNGKASSKINVDIPLYKDIDLNSVLIKVESNIKNNNTFIFSNNSELNLFLIKDYNSNNFKTKVNLDKSYINFSGINFTKNKNISTSLNLDIIINDKEVLLGNIYTNSDYIKLNGNGKIIGSDLVNLDINNIQYENNKFNVKYFINDSNEKILNIDGEKIGLNFDKDLLSNNNFKNDFNNLTVNCFFNNLLINDKYTINSINSNLNFKNGNLDNLNLFNIENNEKTLNIEVIKNKQKETDREYDIYIDIKNIGKFLSDSSINDNIIGGDLYVKSYIENNKVYADLKIRNEFNIITKDMKNLKFFNYIINSDIVSKNTKNKLKKENSLVFEKMYATLNFDTKIIDIKNFILESNSMFGIGISGGGKIFIDTGEINFNGLVIPVDKINTLFGMNKIPIINKILFGNRDSGLFNMGYSFYKQNYDSKYEFKLIPVSASNMNSLKNIFLLLFLL